MAEDNNELLREISVSLATNTEATRNIERHLSQINGKIATQEGFQATLKLALDMQNITVQELVTKEKERSINAREWRVWSFDNISKIILAILLTWLLIKLGLK